MARACCPAHSPSSSPFLLPSPLQRSPRQPGKTYLAPYVIEGYGRIYIRMKLWPYPRGHHRHVAAIPWR